MEEKQWPMLAQIIIALGVISSFMGLLKGISYFHFLDILSGAFGVAIFWSLYKFKGWARIGLTVYMVIKIMNTIILISRGVRLSIGLTAIVISALIIYYFNSPKIKKMFV